GNPISTALAGQSVRFDVQPVINTAATLPAIMTVKDLLDPCEIAPTLTTTADWTMSVVAAANDGPDGLACTADDVSGERLAFTSTAPVSPGSVPMLSYQTQLVPSAADDTVAINTAEFTEPG